MPRSFNQYINETKDIFGFERAAKKNAAPPPDENPIHGFDAMAVIDEMMKHPVNNKPAREVFVSNGVAWGGGPGMIRCEASPYGSDRLTIRRLIEDLEGTPCWIAKKIFPLSNQHRDHKVDEATMAYNLLEEISNIDKSLLEMPLRAWDGLEKLVFKLSGRVRVDAPEIFVYEGMRRLNPYLYIIYMSVRGHGVEGPDSERVEEFVINVAYSEATGLIRCWGNDVSSTTSAHEWKSRPSEWDEYFSPAQSDKEIVEAIINAFKTY